MRYGAVDLQSPTDDSGFIIQKPIPKSVPPQFYKPEQFSYKQRLPADLLILNRFGIGYPYLKAAWKLSQKHQIAPVDILIRTKIITFSTWLEAQQILREERELAETKRKQDNFLLTQAITNLNTMLPNYSAKKVITWQQGIFLIVSIALIAWLFHSNYQSTFFFCFLFLAAFYSFSILLRGYLLASLEPTPPPASELITTSDNALPVYSVLVALYKEANQIEGLTRSLYKLDWPKNKLDIKLICEADDHETITAIVDANLPPCFELIVVPPAQPRTKPKALNFALPLCRGEYVVLYDAEDHPSPGQLREAYATFQTEPENLACVQAPLHIHNLKQNWLTAMFAIEYYTLFNGILPVLAKWKVPVPLGGTSNHFKIRILKNIGAWDPYNMTEDADLGIRLFREGYRCKTISLPTYEEAPPKLMPWIKQRTRWLKGWMQTVLVHNRNPVHFISDTGMKNAIAFHVLLTSIIISSLIHPFFILFSVWQLLNLGVLVSTNIDAIIIATSVFNLVGGYTTYALLAYGVLRTTRHKSSSLLIFTLPLYWLLISIAGWRALIHIIVKPHEWEKTPHGLAV